MSKYDFSNDTQHYYEWVFDTFTDATRLVWELGGYELQSGKDLDTQWEAIQPILKDAFEKAEKWDEWSTGEYRMIGRLKLREMTEKLEAIETWTEKNKDEYLDNQDWDKLEKILRNSYFKENDEK